MEVMPLGELARCAESLLTLPVTMGSHAKRKKEITTQKMLTERSSCWTYRCIEKTSVAGGNNLFGYVRKSFAYDYKPTTCKIRNRCLEGKKILFYDQQKHGMASSARKMDSSLMSNSDEPVNFVMLFLNLQLSDVTSTTDLKIIWGQQTDNLI